MRIAYYRIAVFFGLLFLCAFLANAQNLASQSLRKGSWEFEPFFGGGTGVGKSSGTQFLLAGARVGRILTRDKLHNFLRGNFELAADFMPMYLVMQRGGTVYGASFKPVILKWNFTDYRKIVPYFYLAGGVLFSTSNVPPGNTSYVNFTPQGAIGFHFFTRPKRAWDFEVQYVHHSNAGLGTENPGYNGSFLFTVGYSWFK